MASEPDDPMYGEIKLSLRGLYHAGRVEMPEKAASAASAASSLAGAIDTLDGEAAKCGNPRPLMDALSVLHDIYHGLTLATKNLDHGAVGLVHIADDFSKSDELAGQAHDNLGKRLTQHRRPDLPDAPGSIEDPVTGGAQPGPAPSSPEDDLSDRDDSVRTPDLPDDVERD